MPKRKVGALEKVDADLAALQYKCRCDPPSYEDDFRKQYMQFESYRELFLLNPGSSDEGLTSFRELIDFVSHVGYCYPKITADFPNNLTNILTLHHEELEADLREKIVGSLCLLRTNGVLGSSALLNTLIPILISTPSKSLRELLFSKILSVLRSANAKTTNHKLNRTIQNVLHNLVVSDRSAAQGVWACRVTRQMWRRQIWSDAKAVEIMKEASLAENAKVICAGVTFFLGADQDREEAADESDDGDNIDMGQLRHQVGINKKTKKKDRELKKAAATVKRKERKKNQPPQLNFSALQLLHDPQGFAEALFSRHVQSNKTKLNLEQKLLVLSLVSRLVGLHKLTIISLYSYFLKYLTPRQNSVTSFLAYLAQATHSLVPPDLVEPAVQKIANEFVSEAAASEIAAAGLNAIREICARQPLAMTDTLLQDLVLYRKSKDKGVQMAARGLLSLYREVGAELLKKRDRGKDAAMGLKAGSLKERRYGEEELGEIEGLDLLEKWKEEERRKQRIEQGLPPDAASDEEEPDEAENWKNWEFEEGEESDDSGGWINVDDDGDDNIVVSDSEDEKQPPAKKVKVDATADGEKADAAAADGEKENTENSVGPESKSISKLATTRILTPADLAKLQELRLASQITSSMPSAKRRQALADRHADDPLTAAEIEAPALLGKKSTKEEKIAMAKGDRETTHQSTTAKRKEKKMAEGKSTTNKEKARKKNFLMTLGKAKGKQKRSLVDVKKTLRGHIERQKRGGKRGNR